jgi:MFS family permease
MLPPTHEPDSRYAWARLAVTLALMTIGSGAMYVVAVVLPAVQAEFGVVRADASLPYTMMMVGFGLGGIAMGKLADRFGVMWVVLVGACGLCTGFIAAGLSGSLMSFALVHGVLLGACGSAATFAPLVADTSLWFVRRRGIAVAICASGNYLGGAIWPPVVQHFVATDGWRHTYIGLGIFCGLAMALLAPLMRARPPLTPAAPAARTTGHAPSTRPFGLSMNQAQALLCVAGVACCVAMAMPQYATMWTCGIVSRLVSGLICDRIGGLRTLLLGSVLQGLALLLFIPFDGLLSLYVISALFGLFQGGIVPSYAIIVREHFPAAEAGARVGTVIMATLFGMARLDVGQGVRPDGLVPRGLHQRHRLEPAEPDDRTGAADARARAASARSCFERRCALNLGCRDSRLCALSCAMTMGRSG